MPLAIYTYVHAKCCERLLMPGRETRAATAPRCQFALGCREKIKSGAYDGIH